MTFPSQRHLFEIPEEVAYLDGAAFSPLPRAVRDAGELGVAAKSRPWSRAPSAGDDAAERARAAAARLIGAGPDDVAIVGSVAAGIATAARNLPLTPGHRVLHAAEEFPSLTLVLHRLAAERGLILDVVPRPADADWTATLLAAVERPGAPPVAVAALTPLHWCDGALMDLARIIPAVRRQGGAVIVDATQAVGVLPVDVAADVAALRPDFLAFPTYKWVLGPYSLAFLYAAPDRQGGVPIEEHGVNTPGGHPAPGARRYDKGERNDPVALPMAATGLELVGSWDRAAVAARLRLLTDALADAAEGVGLRPVPRPHRAPHILGLRLPGGLPPDLLANLAARGVYASDRRGVLRVSPHVWAHEGDVARFAAAVAALLGTRRSVSAA